MKRQESPEPRTQIRKSRNFARTDEGVRSTGTFVGNVKERRVRSQIFVVALAFLLDRMLERALRDAKVNLSATTAWRALETIRHVRFRIDGEIKTGVTPGRSAARQVLKALHLSETRPPLPPKGQETTT